MPSALQELGYRSVELRPQATPGLPPVLGASVARNLADGLVVLGAGDSVQWLNRAMYALLELPSSLPLPCTLDSTCPMALLELLRPGGAVVGPYEACLTLPSRAGVALRVTPLALEPPWQGRVLVVRDTTSERDMCREMHGLIAQVAHELRTPMQHILTYAGLLSDLPELTQAERAEFLRTIQDESMTLSLLLDDLLQWGRLSKGRLSVRRRRTRLDELVTRTVDRFRPRAQAAGLLMEVAALPVVWALTDPLRLEQVLSNVLGNALAYVPRGQSVRVSLVPEHDRASISVADTGPGIAPEAQARLFEPYRNGNGGEAAPGSVGLGLSISRQIMGALGGSIHAESQLGEGSTFTIQVPLVREPLKGDAA